MHVFLSTCAATLMSVSAGCNPAGWGGNVDDEAVGCPAGTPVRIRVRMEGRGQVVGAADSACFDRGAEIALDARAADGWVFQGWFGDVTSVQPVMRVTLAEDTSVRAVFRRIPRRSVPQVFAPFPAGTASFVLQGPFGPYTHGDETSWDFHLPWGTQVLAAEDGVVVDLVESLPRNPPGRPPREGQANFVMLEHDGGWLTRYVHLDTEGVFVEIGQRVRRGHLLAITGDTGLTFDPHLRFETRDAGGGPLLAGFAESLRPEGEVDEGDVLVSQNRPPLPDADGL